MKNIHNPPDLSFEIGFSLVFNEVKAFYHDLDMNTTADTADYWVMITSLFQSVSRYRVMRDMLFFGVRNELTNVLFRTKSVLATLILFSCIINVFMLATAIYMLQRHDWMLANVNITALLMITFLMIGIYILIAILEAVRSLMMIRIENRLEQQLNKWGFGAAFFTRNLRQECGTPAQALSDLTNARQFLGVNSLFSYFDVPWLLLYLAVAFLIHPILGWLTLFGSGLLVSLAVLTEIFTNKSLSQADKLAIAGSTLLNDQLRNSEAIEAMGLLGSHQIKAGMPANITIKTGERTLLSYLLKPLLDRIDSSLNEQYTSPRCRSIRTNC